MNEIVEHTGGQELAAPKPSMLQMIARLASDPAVDPAKFRELLAIQRDLEADQAKRDYTAALVQLQAKLPRITKKGEIMDKEGRIVMARFARFEDIIDKIETPLRDHGFTVSFVNGYEDGKPSVTCILRHAGGFSDSSTIVLPVDPSGFKNNIQGVGSALSYGRRYTLCGLLNLVTVNEDDDGRGAVEQERISEEQRDELLDLLAHYGRNVDRFCRHYEISSVGELPLAKLQHARKEIVAAAEKARAK